MKKINKCGYAAIIGRPNVGKSSLLNKLLAKKISIVSHKAQTTRHRILGIKTTDSAQIIYVDTPGIHRQEKKQKLNQLMNKAAYRTMYDADIIIFMIDAVKWTEEDERILKSLKTTKTPIILALNKIDLMKDKKRLLPLLESLSKKFDFEKIIPISVLKNVHLIKLENLITDYLPDGPPLFPKEQITDHDNGFLTAEIIREKILQTAHKEVPYNAAVSIDSMKVENNIMRINATIWVEREGQKKILIGNKGEKLKMIGSRARIELEKQFNQKIFLRLWVKVKSGWTDREADLKCLGI